MGSAASNLMGYRKTINARRYPKQGSYLGRAAEVCFDYDTSATMQGKVIRDDAEEPGLMLIQLENGWVVKSTECQWRPL